MLDLRRPMGYRAFASLEVARELQRELPWELDSSGLLWTPLVSSGLDSQLCSTAGKKNPAGKAHVEISE